MKDYRTIKADIEKAEKDIERYTNMIIDLDNVNERRAAADIRDFAKVKELRQAAEMNADKIRKLSDKINNLKISVKIMKDNFKYSLSCAGLEAIKDVLSKYDGKAYGEKTREKIRADFNARGLSIYFDSWGISSAKNTAEINYLVNGYTYDYNNKGILHSDANPFITEDNKVNCAGLNDIVVKGSYVEDIPGRVKAIKKAYANYKKAVEAAGIAQGELNSIIPAGCSFRNVDTYIKTF